MKNLILIVVLILVILLYTMKNIFHYSPLWVNILNDILAIPVILLFMNYVMKKITGKEFQMNNWYIIGTILVVSVFFEGIFPAISKQPTADYLDVIWYMIGGLLFVIFTRFVFENTAR